MPISPSTVIRHDLGAALFEADPTAMGFIADELLPFVDVPERNGVFYRISIEDLLAMPEVDRAVKGTYAQDDFELESDTFSCTQRGYEGLLDDVERGMYASSFNAEEVVAMRAAGIVMRRREKRVADMLFNTTTFPLSGTTGASVANEWDDPTNATPGADGDNAINQIIENTGGTRPDTLVIARSTFYDLGRCDDVVDRIKFTNPNVVRGQLGPELLAQYFGVDRVLVGGGMYNSANKGLAYSGANHWDHEYAMFLVTDSGLDLQRPSIGRTFAFAPGGGRWTVEQYRKPDRDSDVFRVKQDVQEKIFLVACGFLLGNITS